MRIAVIFTIVTLTIMVLLIGAGRLAVSYGSPVLEMDLFRADTLITDSKGNIAGP